MSVDGAKVRSDAAGPNGPTWFDILSGVLTIPGVGMPKAQIAGDISPDALFEGMRSIWRQSPGKDLPLVFVADGAEWIWNRIGFYFPKAIQVLDIYHASEHVASGGRAAWSDQSSLALHWAATGIEMLLEKGPRGSFGNFLARCGRETYPTAMS